MNRNDQKFIVQKIPTQSPKRNIQVFMTVPVGSIYGFIGENGSAKLTNMKQICSHLPVLSLPRF